MMEALESFLIGRLINRFLRLFTQGQGSQPQLAKHIEKSSISFLGIKREYYLRKDFSESGFQEKIENKKQQLPKNKKLSKSYKKAEIDLNDFASLKKAAKKGDAEAQFQLAFKYYRGKGVEKNLEKTFKWSFQAAEQGHIIAQFNVGNLYDKGEGVEQDIKEAIRWYTKAAEQGFVYAQNNLGSMYHRGEGVGRNFREAIRWYTKAVEQGHASAQFNLGNMCYFGEGVLENYKKAFQWYTKSAEQGHASAQYNLGTMYYRGEGVEKNLSMAYGLYLLAAQGDDETAKNNLPKLRLKLTTEQIAEGQKIAQEWQAKIEANAHKKEE